MPLRNFRQSRNCSNYFSCIRAFELAAHTTRKRSTLHNKNNHYKILSLLTESEYRGIELEGDIPQSSLFSLPKLLNHVQASESEIKEMLGALPVAEVDGCFRLLGFEYHFRVLEFMLTSIESNSMPLDKIDTNVVIEEVNRLIRCIDTIHFIIVVMS